MALIGCSKTDPESPANGTAKRNSRSKPIQQAEDYAAKANANAIKGEDMPENRAPDDIGKK